MRKLFLFIMFFLALLELTQGQTGILQGKITDSESGEALIGANIRIEDKALGASTDLDGKYVIRNVPPGTYSITISYVGYSNKHIVSIEVKAGQSVTINSSLEPQNVTVKEVEVTAERKLSSESAILAMRKRMSNISDGFSAEHVKLSADATTSDALRRVTGVSLVDNKFVFIRGITDRYNSTMLNGTTVTSTDTDTDKKSFTFDMIPSNLIENTMVTKTSSADLPGDFTGGLIQMNTLDFPDHGMYKLGISGAFNNMTTYKQMVVSQGGSRDWLATDDGKRSFPTGNLDQYELGRTLPNDWAQKSGRAPENKSFSFAGGDRFFLGEDQFGIIGAISYRSGYNRTETRNQYYQDGAVSLLGGGTRDVYSVLWGTLLNASYKFDGLHKLSVKTTYNKSAEDRVTALRVVDENEADRDFHVTEWDQRSLFQAQVTGEHMIPAVFSGMDIQWRAAYNSSYSERPDRKTYNYTKNVRQPNSAFAIDQADRSWSNLDEFSRSAGTDISFSHPFGKIKTGGFYEHKERYFNIQSYVAELDRNSTNFQLRLLPIDSIFTPDNFGKGLFTMSRISSPRDVYTGDQELFGTYLMGDFTFRPFEQQVRITAGARLENSTQHVSTIKPTSDTEPFIALVKNIDILPSVNFTYSPIAEINLRLAYSQSVNRPEFRELSSFFFYDYSVYEGSIGNPLLVRALAHNLDARVEFFPGLGEVLAVSLFRKRILNPIEQFVLPGSNPVRTWINSPRGTNDGWELELRKSFGFIGSYFSNISLGFNYTKVFSSIEYQDGYLVDVGGGTYETRFRTLTREMQGQTPWVLNVNFLFREPTLGSTLNIMYNGFGHRLEAVGAYRSEDIYLQSWSSIDLALIQQITSALELKFTIRDLQARERVYELFDGSPYRVVKAGSNYSLSVSYTFN